MNLGLRDLCQNCVRSNSSSRTWLSLHWSLCKWNWSSNETLKMLINKWLEDNERVATQSSMVEGRGYCGFAILQRMILLSGIVLIVILIPWSNKFNKHMFIHASLRSFVAKCVTWWWFPGRFVRHIGSIENLGYWDKHGCSNGEEIPLLRHVMFEYRISSDFCRFHDNSQIENCVGVSKYIYVGSNSSVCFYCFI